MNSLIIILFVIILLPFLTACGGGGGGDSEKKPQQQGFSRVIVFGDSLSDIGNDLTQSLNETGYPMPPDTRYFSGRFSNGTVWTEYLAADMGIPVIRASLDPSLDPAKREGVSFAYGSAGTGLANSTPNNLITVRGLLGQVSDFAAMTKGVADPAALYVVWSGGNDYVQSGVSAGIPVPPNPAVTVGNIAGAIQSLYSMGARHFLVLNLPDLGETPLVAAIESTSPGIGAAMTELTLAHNFILGQAINQLVTAYTDMFIYHADIYSLLKQISANPLVFGFIDTLTTPGPATGCLVFFGVPNCSVLPGGFDAGGSIFWDDQHPTTQMHALIAQKARDAIAVNPIQSAQAVAGMETAERRY
jgi:phospholipase/lecithinase/hemolysin